MEQGKRIKVLLAEDHCIVREGVRELLGLEADIEVVGEAATGRAAVEMAGQLRPDVVVMDIAMPQLNGMEATRRIAAESSGTKVIILSAHSDDAYVEQCVAMGAMGFLVKQSSAQILSEAIREVVKGNTFFSPAIAKKIHHQQQLVLERKGRKTAMTDLLTPRETEVLQLIAEGAANKLIASDLGISVKTVEKHRSKLMQKLDIHDTAGLVRYAIAAGVIECNVQLTIE